jgi:xanthine dehydrogenase YagR molybdenum-binding subunit
LLLARAADLKFLHHSCRTTCSAAAGYHVPVNADVHDIDVIFVEEHDEKINPLGVKGVGEIGVVNTAAAIANAVCSATRSPGRRGRETNPGS